ncbi:thioesterase family protein [Pseudooceanicola onchidii]|uniref:thioesterase family protein n=1 Tax=Pseudooceanicola onchidii TaxID=2562279 RepID=UPI0010AAC4DB|nr:thioesterase family protein [Pseudooceanicola onchidii]
MSDIFLSPEMEVKPEWIDQNGHLNMAYYGVLFDTGVDEVAKTFGLGWDYTSKGTHTTYSAEFRIRYVRELHVGDKVRASFRLLDVGPKAHHFCQELIHEDGWIAATGEGISLHIDQSGPRVAPYPPEVLAKLTETLDAHAKLPVPDWVGAPMAIRK